MKSHAEILTDAEEWITGNPDAPLGKRIGMAMFVESRAEAGATITLEQLATRLGLTEDEALEALNKFINEPDFPESAPMMMPWDGKFH